MQLALFTSSRHPNQTGFATLGGYFLIQPGSQGRTSSSLHLGRRILEEAIGRLAVKHRNTGRTRRDAA
jgi:hypothetical protein